MANHLGRAVESPAVTAGESVALVVGPVAMGSSQPSCWMLCLTSHNLGVHWPCP